MSEFQGWIANLSNGETILETSQPDGEKSTWQKLLARCQVESLTITALQLVRYNVKVVAMPLKTCDGFFQAYERHMSMRHPEGFTQQGIGTVKDGKAFITWVVLNCDPYDFIMFQEVRALESCLKHTTLGKVQDDTQEQTELAGGAAGADSPA